MKHLKHDHFTMLMGLNGNMDGAISIKNQKSNAPTRCYITKLELSCNLHFQYMISKLSIPLLTQNSSIDSNWPYSHWEFGGPTLT